MGVGRKRGFTVGPRYWDACRKMDSGELGGFVRACLREPPGFGEGPRTKQDLLALLELLARKDGLVWERDNGGRVWENGDFGKYRKLLNEQDRARRSLRIAQDGVPRDLRLRGGTTARVKKERRKLMAVERQIMALEREAGVRGDGPDVPPAEAPAEGATKRQLKAYRRAWRRHELVDRRRVIANLAREIEAAFHDEATDPESTAAVTPLAGVERLPWRVLPAGELTLERVLSHYGGLGRDRPDVRYEPERIRKAYSLGPDGCFVGTDEFEGYIVFTFPGTGKALLECPVYGHAIYVLGPDWRRLSRLSKGDLLSNQTRGVTKIVHRGEWFARTKAALGLR